jgi:branched-chain amino acid transport system permease protein
VAQGAMIVLGAFLSYTLFTKLHIDPFVSVVLLTPLMFLVGVVLQLVFIRPLRADEREELSLLVTWALALGIEGLLSVLYKTDYRSTITSYADKSWRVAGYHLSEVRVFAFAMSAAIIGLLYVLLTRTEFGRTVRATVQNPVSARLLGVNIDRVSALGFGISVATATAAGAVFGMITPFYPGSHYDLISRLLSIIVLGGLGSLLGAVVAALFMGVAEALFAAEISPTWSSFTFFIVLILILLVRPQGLFGTNERGAL